MAKLEHKIRKALFLIMLRKKVDSATILAKEVAHYIHRADWLDDDQHPVWDLALEFFPEPKIHHPRKGETHVGRVDGHDEFSPCKLSCGLLSPFSTRCPPNAGTSFAIPRLRRCSWWAVPTLHAAAMPVVGQSHGTANRL